MVRKSKIQGFNQIKGPGSSIWYCIEAEHVPAFRALVKNLHKYDIHEKEGLWFGDIDTCLENGIDIKYFIQEPGDIVSLTKVFE